MHTNHSFLGEGTGRNQSDDYLQTEIRQHTASYGGRQCENRAFHEQLPDEAAAGCSQGGAHGYFPLAGGGTAQEKVRNIAAGDQKQQQDSTEQGIECFLKVSDETVEQRLRDDRELIFRENSTWVRLVHAVRDSIEVCSGSLYANTWPKPSHQRAADLVGTEGFPKVCAKSVELQGHDSNEGCRLAVEDKSRIQDLWIATEFSLPEPVIHHEHGRSVRAFIVL